MLENPDYLSKQLVTCIGNKRALLPLIGEGVTRVREFLGKEKLSFFDAFSGSGIVSRYFKQFASAIYANDLESYARAISLCFLTNKEDADPQHVSMLVGMLEDRVRKHPVTDGFIRRLYAPKDDQNIQPGERAFYTVENAIILDSLASGISELYAFFGPQQYYHALMGPLLSEASIHANTSGVFKGFYKDKETGIGKFGGHGQDALKRICGRIKPQVPVLSNFSCKSRVYCGDANLITNFIPEVDVAYFDPPYNQHPYGSNYFMLNLLCEYEEPQEISSVSGIPKEWRRSDYNQKAKAADTFRSLVISTRAKFILASYNEEGFISPSEMHSILSSWGEVEKIEQQYNTFRGGRNPRSRPKHVKEMLFIVKRRGL